jgi:thioredoxin-dependent peroxiredoxin
MLAPMLYVGARAPEFSLPDQDGRRVTLSSLLNNGPLVLYFYPKDFTPVCTREACSIRDLHDDIVKAKLHVAGISPQKPARHREFRQAHNLPFTLLSDTRKEVARMYEAVGFLGIGVQRITYLLDPARYVMASAKSSFSLGPHLGLIERAIALNT